MYRRYDHADGCYSGRCVEQLCAGGSYYNGNGRGERDECRHNNDKLYNRYRLRRNDGSNGEPGTGSNRRAGIRMRRRNDDANGCNTGWGMEHGGTNDNNRTGNGWSNGFVCGDCDDHLLDGRMLYYKNDNGKYSARDNGGYGNLYRLYYNADSARWWYMDE
jgi:hypothetical protein